MTALAARKATPAADATPALTVEKVTPAQRTRKGTVKFPKDTIDQLAEFIKNGEYAGDGQRYDSRQQANTRVSRLKRALIHFGHYKAPKEIKSRVWQDDDGKWRLALTNAAAAK